MTFDIECVNDQGHFPNAARDPMVMISNIACEDDGKGGAKKYFAVMFALGTYDQEKLKSHPLAAQMPCSCMRSTTRSP